MKNLLLIVTVLFFSLTSFSQKSTEQQLEQLKGVEVTKVPTLNGFSESFLLMITQPVDHNNPDGAKFQQRVWLSKINIDRPTVIITDGYSMPQNYQTEIARLLKANQVLVEHRYFGKSVPDSMNWSKLNLFQECQDLHHIRTILGKIFKKPWISSGISKGGQTTIAYKFFFPNDVSASVPYVAPFTFAKEDPRVIDFIANKVANKKSRAKILAFQKGVLSHKDTFLPLVKDFMKKMGLTFNDVGGAESGFEHGMLEFSFAFWQWGYPINEVPNNVMNIDSTMFILRKVNSFDFFSDQDDSIYRPYFYQALTQMGIYTYNTKPFKGLLKYANNPHFDFTIKNIPHKHYSVCLNTIMNQWLQENGNNMIYIYGGIDPWGSCSMKVDNSKVNSLKLVDPTGSHTTRIYSFNKKTQKRIIDSLSVWTGYKFKYLF